MTEKISRRGVATPHSYEPDILNSFTVKQVLREEAVIIGHNVTLVEARAWLGRHKEQQQNFYIVADEEGMFKGVVSSSNLFSLHHTEDYCLETLIRRKPVVISSEESLRTAVELMARKNMDVLPVKSTEGQQIIGVLT